jgi:hypothetical protein
MVSAVSLFGLLLWCLPVLASGDESCFAAASQGQKFEKSGKLLEAQLQYAECAKAECPAEVTSTCTGFLRRAEDATPSLLIDLKGADGKEVPNAAEGTISVDAADMPFAQGSSKPLRVNPGPHKIRVAVGAFQETQTVMVREHEKGRVIRFVERTEAPRPIVSPKASGIPGGALVAGGVGAVGLGVFAVFGILGITERSDAGCDAGCVASDYDRIQTKFLVADVALGVGIAGVVVAGAFLLFGKRGEELPAKALGRVGVLHF